ncbi:MAG: hypothetical protein RLZZ124_1757 [Cyanobacteriota bacterium]|jgi:hypothetical protein
MSADLVVQLARLEAISRDRPDRVLRLIGFLPAMPVEPGSAEPYELLIFRGFSSSTTHPTAFDPDQCVLPHGVVIEAAVLLQGPLNPVLEQVLAGPAAPERFLDPSAWL